MCGGQGHTVTPRKVTLYSFKCACGKQAQSRTATYRKPCTKCHKTGMFAPCSVFNLSRAAPRVSTPQLETTGGPMIHSLRQGAF